MKKIIIAAIAQDNSGRNIIGLENKLIWKIKEDMKRFVEVTTNHPIIMGHDTYKSIGKPLKNRTTVVLSRNRKIEKPELNGETKLLTAGSLVEAFYLAEQDALEREVNEIYLGGGENVYQQTMHLVDELDITHVYGTFQGNKFFPTIEGKNWKEVWREPHYDLGFCFTKYQRV